MTINQTQRQHRIITPAGIVPGSAAGVTAGSPARRIGGALPGVTRPRPGEPVPARERPGGPIAPGGTEARGFVLYVGIDEAKALQDGVRLSQIVEALKERLAEIAPSAESYAAVALAPAGAGGRDVDVVRRALNDPTAVAERKKQATPEPQHLPGVVIDITRKRVTIEGENVGLTYKEFELLQFLVLREGRTIERQELIETLWASDDDEAPNERTIDVHIRRLRAKLAGYEDIVRTVRGAGYRFDRHADVSIRYASTPSPDVF